MVAQVIVKGDNADEQERAFIRAVIQQLKEKSASPTPRSPRWQGRPWLIREPLN
jgi:hypothetical protein